VTLKFRGREMSHQELGLQLIENLKLELDAYGTVEQSPKLEGRQITMLIATKKK
jgi:translation initiation factor IF-3